jgi:predicted small lipoprotein YifL
MSRLKAVLVVLLCLSMLAACGKKGKLEQPEGSDHPRQYPTR